MDDEIISMNIRIEGDVQGVGFREFATREANSRGLKGWVRNRADETVEIVACGLRSDVEAFITACIAGPRGSRVTACNLEPAELPTNLGFTRRPSV
jgi:acylphosphatase